MNLVHNEQVKLLAGTLNSVGIATIATGFIAPTTSYVYGIVSAASAETVIALTIVWLSCGSILLMAARHSLRGLRE